MAVLYTAEAVATGAGRDGHVRSSDGLIDFDLAKPKEMGGRGGAPNPELLFAAGYAACFHNALLGVIKRAGLQVEGSTVTARVGIGRNDNGVGFGLTVTLRIALPGVDEATAKDLVDKAHQVCPYSNATRGNIDVTLELV
jgi:osmotically inducible protein OsmC